LPPSPYGFVVARAGGLAGPLLDALKLLIANGTYSRIAAKWGVANGEIVNPVINGATG
jgi:ABC-type amino acid transport substrate-binding protein